MKNRPLLGRSHSKVAPDAVVNRIPGEASQPMHMNSADAYTDEERHYQARLRALLEVSSVLVLTHSVDDLCRRAVELGQSRLGFDRLGIWLCETECSEVSEPSSGSQGPQMFRGTFGIDEAGDLRDERYQYTPIDERAQKLVDAGLAMPFERSEGTLYDADHQAVGQGVWVRAVIRDGDHFAGVIGVDNLLSGRDLTSRDGDLLALYAVMLSNLLYRRRAEMVLREREAYYRTLFETTGTAMLVVNEDATIVLANAESERLFGISRHELMHRTTWREFVVPDDLAKVENYGRQPSEDAGSVASGVRERREFRIVDALGVEHDILAYTGSIPATQQTLISLLDITEQKQAAEQARRRAARQSALNAVIAEASEFKDPVTLLRVVLDQATAALGVDKGICWMLGYTVWKGLPEHIPELADRVALLEDAGRRPRAIRDWRNVGEPWAADVAPVFRAAGVRSSLSTSILGPQEDKSTSGLMLASATRRNWSEHECDFIEAIAHQLATAMERQQLQDRVRQQAQRLQLLVDSVPEGVVLLGVGGEVMMANPTAQVLLKRFSGVGVGDTLTALGSIPLAQLLMPSPAIGWREYVEGDTILQVDAHPLADIYRLNGWVLLLWDGTESRRIERQLQQQERLAAVGRLAAGIAHDFNNIMAIIILYSQMVARESGLSPRSRDYMDIVRKQAHRATDLIEQILDFSRSTHLDRHPIDLIPYLKEMLKLWERTLPESIRFELVHDQSLHRVNADPSRLQQALLNLATNARDAMPKGGKIRIEVQRVTYDSAGVPVPTMAPGDWILLRFSDTGTGIPKDLLTRVFEPFFTTKDPREGTGLGLSQVYGIVKQHDGEVTLDSVVDQGTTVTLYLPALTVPLEGYHYAPAMAVPVAGLGETILVVEDNRATREALVDALIQLDYRVVEASTGIEALAVLDAQGDDIALVLSDAIMPEMGGAQLLAALAERGDSHPVVILSGYAASSEQAELRAMPNFVAWLTKPVELARLAEVVRENLSRRAAE